MIQVTPYQMLRMLISEQWTNPDPVSVATWLIEEKSGLLRLALRQLIYEAAELRADDEAAQELLEARPALRPIDGEMKAVAEALGVARRYLYTLTTDRLARAIGLAESIFALRADAAAARNAMRVQ